MGDSTSIFTETSTSSLTVDLLSIFIINTFATVIITLSIIVTMYVHLNLIAIWPQLSFEKPVE